MKIVSKKAIRIIVVFALILFVGYNIVWYFLVHSKYDEYVEGMEVFIKNRSYVFNDDGFLYNVKYPDYLTLTGNLCVATNDDKYALLIWPGILGETEYAVQIMEEDGGRYQILMDENKKPIDPADKAVIDTYKDKIDLLFEKDQRMWNRDK